MFFVRGGRIRGQRGWISAIEDADGAGLVSQLLIQVYGEYSQARTGRKAKARATSVDDVAHTAATEASSGESGYRRFPTTMPSSPGYLIYVARMWLSRFRSGAL